MLPTSSLHKSIYRLSDAKDIHDTILDTDFKC